MIFNHMTGIVPINPGIVDMSNIYGYGDGYFPERHGILGRPNMRG